MTDLHKALTDLEQRVTLLEKQLDVAIRAFHLLTVVHKPTSKWLDAKLAEIDGEKSG